ncbi:hypothetical protein AALB16_08765 [Lachnospiraceae bacterium 62-35]
MKKSRFTIFTALCYAMLTLGGSIVSFAQMDFTEPVRIAGPASPEDGRLVIDNQSNVSSAGDIVINLSEDTPILDSVNGFPMELKDIKKGDMVYAYLSPAMTMSLPPQTSAYMILAGVPEDFKVPDYLKIDSFTPSDKGYILKTVDGTSFTVPSDCAITPYLTRQLVRLEDLAKGRVCLLWSDDTNTAYKIVLFNENDDSSSTTKSFSTGSSVPACLLFPAFLKLF